MSRVIQNLEIHAAHACNLVCESCSHYSNQGHHGFLSPEEMEESLNVWHARLLPGRVSILGGEPTLNPRLVAIVRLARRYWPATTIRIVSNGFFLHRHPELPCVLGDDPDAQLCLSVHHNSPPYLQRLRPVADLLEEWSERCGVKIEVLRSFEDWTVRYRGAGRAMEPFADNDRRASWENCPAKDCPQLFERKAWKCPAVAYLQLQARKYAVSSNWDRYLAYRPLEATCSAEELDGFFAREDEECCEMCPARPMRIRPPLPLREEEQRNVRPITEMGGEVDLVLRRLEALSSKSRLPTAERCSEIADS